MLLNLQTRLILLAVLVTVPSPSLAQLPNDGTVDALDLSIWEDQYGQPAPLVAAEEMVVAVSLTQDSSSSADAPTAIASLIDAALALEWMDYSEENSLSEAVFEESIDEVLATNNSSSALLPSSQRSNEVDEGTSSSEAAESDDVWLSDEFLERVFG